MNIRFSPYEPEFEAIPHAIFWRPISYFTTKIREEHDDLDYYSGASFVHGNDLIFDLRHYRGHPQYTSTMYLSAKLESIVDIRSITDLIIKGLEIPKMAVAWRRGVQFEHGKLSRVSIDRIRESEARIIALKIASQCKNRTATTEYIKQNALRYFDPSEIDLKPSTSRSGEQHWQQIIGNVISHRNTSKGPFKLGYATRTKDGMTVTDQGVAYLNSLGFSV